MGGVIPEDTRNYWEIDNLTSIEFTLNDQPGQLLKCLDFFRTNNLDLTRINSKPSKKKGQEKVMQFYADFRGKPTDEATQNLLKDLQKICAKVQLVSTPEVPWFPTSLYDFDHIGKRILGAGDGI